MINFHIEQAEIDKCLKDVRKYSKKKQDQIWGELVDAANNTVKNAVAKAPETPRNRLRNDIGAKFDKGQINTRVGTAIDYAPYVEFGTGTLVDIPDGLEDYAMQFKGKGLRQVNLPARPFLFPAFFKEQKELLKRIKRIFK